MTLPRGRGRAATWRARLATAVPAALVGVSLLCSIREARRTVSEVEPMVLAESLGAPLLERVRSKLPSISKAYEMILTHVPEEGAVFCLFRLDHRSQAGHLILAALLYPRQLIPVYETPTIAKDLLPILKDIRYVFYVLDWKSGLIDVPDRWFDRVADEGVFTFWRFRA